MADQTSLSPYPQSSAITDKTFKLGLDWLKWFQDLSYFVTRLLNRYDIRKSGSAILVAGTKVVANTNITATSLLRLTAQNSSGTPGFLSVALNAGVGFTINSTNALDTRTIFYEIVEAF